MRDRSRYPALVDYLDSLPEGLESYPECMSKASAYRALVERLPFAEELEHLPPGLAELITHPVPVSAWISSARYNALFLVALDRFFARDEPRAATWFYELRVEMFRSILYRALMLAMSPAKIFRTAQRRWETFHRGTTLTVDFDPARPHGGSARIDYPAHLQTPLTVRLLGSGLQAALEAAGARELEWQIDEYTPEHTTMSGRWK
ncbi:MAG: hypothetical protein KC468_07990 [Myxococcales bacterium]|nr:hypothetical protein [Myxococcales bacterium]